MSELPPPELRTVALVPARDEAYRIGDTVRALLELPGIDEQEIRGYFERAGLLDRYDEIKKLG